MKNTLNIETKSNTFQVERDGEKWLLNGRATDFDVIKVSERLYHLIYQNHSLTAELVEADPVAKAFTFIIDGQKVVLKARSPMDVLLEKMGISLADAQKGAQVEAPMPGQILEISCEVGQTVAKGDKLFVLEAMKMENVIKSPSDGTVTKIHVKTGENVEKKHLLVVLE